MRRQITKSGLVPLLGRNRLSYQLASSWPVRDFSVQRRLLSKVYRIREPATDATAQENRRDRIDVRRHVFQRSFRATSAALKTAPTCGAGLPAAPFPALGY